MNFHTEKLVPYFVPTQLSSVSFIDEIIIENSSLIENWFKKSFIKFPPPIKSSVDLRHARYKLAPVDTNLFPAGFNNISSDFLPACVNAARIALNSSNLKILLLPENHTRNQFYLQSLVVLCRILSNAGFEVRIGNLDNSVTETLQFTTENGDKLLFEPLIRVENKIKLRDFIPDLLLLNNDLSSGIPEVLNNIEQRIEPSVMLGWSSRYKSEHFSMYDKVVGDFASLLGFDPWLISTFFSMQKDIDFKQQLGLESLVFAVDVLLQKISDKYQQYNITDEPFVVIKADNGTYGMGIMKVRNGSELLEINRKTRNKMSTIKGRQQVRQVILQEGVYSFDTMNNSVSEPVIYMFGQNVVGGFHRVHKDLGVDDNLNTPGMYFEPLTMSFNDKGSSRFYVYSVIARLASLAAAMEMQSVSL